MWSVALGLACIADPLNRAWCRPLCVCERERERERERSIAAPFHYDRGILTVAEALHAQGLEQMDDSKHNRSHLYISVPSLKYPF